jgi:PAS domain S-box-containing protein
VTAPLRILHLEDDPADAALIEAILTNEGLICAIERVHTRVDFERALERDHDLILADFALPGFGGIAAQALARERRPDVPFVFVSGTMGEEVAIERLKDGATDYVLKQRLHRLPSAVRRALDEARGRLERQRAESMIGFLEHLIAASPSMIFRFDPNTLRVTYVSPNVGWLLGYTADEVLAGPNFWESIIHPDDRDRVVARLRSAFAETVVQVEQEYRCRGKDGRYRWFFNLQRIEYDVDGRPNAVLGYALDIADRKAAEETARLAKIESERSSRAKTVFLSRMSHDLRTPMNAVLGFAQLLEIEGLPREQADSVQQILQGGRHLLDLINEILDVARIESGHISLSPEAVPLAEVVQQIVDLIRPLASARGIEVTVDIGPDCPPYVHADRQRLQQILLNLLGNAVKYNRTNGRILVTCAIGPDGSVRTNVTDTGAGILPERLALAFKPFERLGAENTAVEGTGLGLAVSKGLVEAMGGTIGVVSEIDRGSTFWIELPPGHPPEHVVPDANPPPPDTHTSPWGTILYIEDNSANVRLLERLLSRRAAVRLITAASGEEGIVRAGREQPDLILLDLHLPDLPGEEVLRRLWSDPATRGLPVAVLSADATPSQRHRLLAAGAVAYLTKPIDIAQLLELIDLRLAPGPLRVRSMAVDKEKR